MLERTAGCLESGSLRRLMPASKKPLRSRRTLHSTFWGHGAVDINLPSLWSVFVRPTEETQTHPRGILLDFLYPAATLNFLRNYSNWGPEKHDDRWLKAGLGTFGQRQYTSSTRHSSTLNIPTSETNKIGMNQDDAEIATGFIAWNQGDKGVLPKDTDIITEIVPQNERLQLLYQKLGLERSHDYEEAWEQYGLLHCSDQDLLRRQLLDYMSTSDRPVDAGRVVELFEAIEVPLSQDYRFRIRSCLRRGDLLGAMQLHNSALEKLDFPAGSQELLAYLLEKSSWLEACNFWTTRRKWREEHPLAHFNIYEVFDTLPQINAIAIDLGEFVKKTVSPTNAAVSDDTSKLKLFALAIGRRALTKSKTLSSEAVHVYLQNLEDWGTDTPRVYDEAIQVLLRFKETRLTLQYFRKARETKSAFFSRPTLHSILKICCHYHSYRGMQEVLDDFFRLYTKPDLAAYKLCMDEFARKGDADTVHNLFDQFSNQFRRGSYIPSQKDDGPIFRDADDFCPVLNVHARRGEIDKVISCFGQITDVYKLRPTIRCWHILLSAYGKVHDFDNAYECFERVMSDGSLQPDDYTFGTMMGICNLRGDLERTIELYTLAESLNIEKSSAMIDCLVMAHIQYGEVQQAEKICEEALGMKLKGTKTRMWNYLLVTHALSRNLSGVNRLLQRMSEVNIPYDQYTYSAIMQALSIAKQPDRAYDMLKYLLPKAGIQVLSFHYAVVMGGYLANGEVHKVFWLRNRMRRRNIAMTAGTNLMVLQAQVTTDVQAWKKGDGEPPFQTAIAVFREMITSMDPQEISMTPRRLDGRLPLDIAYVTMFYRFIMTVLAQYRQFETVDKLFAEFKQFLPESERDKIPNQILVALMDNKLKQNDYKGVQECWNFALVQAEEEGRALPPLPSLSDNFEKIALKGNDEAPPLISKNTSLDVLLVHSVAKSRKEARNILPLHQLTLARPLMIYLRSLFAENKINEMTATIDSLIGQGFYVDNKNWNLYIEFLTRSYTYELAFKLCEVRLMRNWTGWAWLRRWGPVKNQLPLEVRNMRKSLRYVRPFHTTLLYLARAYLDLQALSAESGPSQRVLEEIERYCPKTVHAIRTMPRSNEDLERSIMGADY